MSHRLSVNSSPIENVSFKRRRARARIFTVQAIGSIFQTTSESGLVLYNGSDPSQAIIAARNAALYGDTVLIKGPDVYPLPSGFSGFQWKTGVDLKGENMPVIDVSNLPVGSTVMSAAGEVIATALPTYPFLKGQTTMNTATSLGAVDGDLVFIWSTDVWHNNSAGLKQGEIRRVVAVNGNTLTLEAPLEDTYRQAATSVSLIESVRDITIEGITFLNTVNAWDTYPSVQQKQFNGLRVIYGDNIRVTNCHFDGIESRAIRFDSVIDSRIDHNVFEKATLYGVGYGVDIIYACQNVVIEYNEAYNCRHFVVAADTSTLSGVPRHITVQHNYAKDSQFWNPSTGTWEVQNQYDCHPVGEDINFLYNEAEGKGYGLSHMGFSGSIIGNNFHDLTLYGIRVGTPIVEGVTEYQDEVLVQDNRITNTTAYGIWLGGSGRYATNIRIPDNIISGCPVVGILMFNAHNCLIDDNSIAGSSIGIRLDVTTSNNQGSGNNCTVSDEGINNDVT